MLGVAVGVRRVPTRDQLLDPTGIEVDGELHTVVAARPPAGELPEHVRPAGRDGQSVHGAEVGVVEFVPTEGELHPAVEHDEPLRRSGRAAAFVDPGDLPVRAFEPTRNQVLDRNVPEFVDDVREQVEIRERANIRDGVETQAPCTAQPVRTPGLRAEVPGHQRGDVFIGVDGRVACCGEVQNGGKHSRPPAACVV